MISKTNKANNNQKIARIFYEMADILEIRNIQWKPRAYRRAAKALELLKKDVSEIYNKYGIDEIEKIPGIGKNLSKKIVEYIKTGKIKAYERQKKEKEAEIIALMKIPGMGPKKIKKIYQKLKIKNIKELKKAIKEHKIAKLPGFGLKSEKDLKKSLELEKGKRYPIKQILPIANEIIRTIKRVGAEKVDVAGSIRRRKATVRDIDILAMSKDPKKIINTFTRMKNVKRIVAKGPTKSTILLKNNVQADLRIVPKESYGAALLYFTGSKNYNIKLREIAIKKGYKLNEYGLFDRKTNKKIAGKTEQEIYKKLGLKYIEPKKREL